MECCSFTLAPVLATLEDPGGHRTQPQAETTTPFINMSLIPGYESDEDSPSVPPTNSSTHHSHSGDNGGDRDAVDDRRPVAFPAVNSFEELPRASNGVTARQGMQLPLLEELEDLGEEEEEEEDDESALLAAAKPSSKLGLPTFRDASGRLPTGRRAEAPDVSRVPANGLGAAQANSTRTSIAREEEEDDDLDVDVTANLTLPSAPTTATTSSTTSLPATARDEAPLKRPPPNLPPPSFSSSKRARLTEREIRKLVESGENVSSAIELVGGSNISGSAIRSEASKYAEAVAGESSTDESKGPAFTAKVWRGGEVATATTGKKAYQITSLAAKALGGKRKEGSQ